MSTVSANLHVKDENGNLYDVQPTTTIANVTGLQAILNSKANSSDVTSGLAGKVDKETGKGLSTNDYTTTEKNKLSGIEAQANKTVVDSALSSSSTNPVQNKVVNTALGTKQDTLSSAQLAAVNSGIDSSKVTQISTNQTNISSLTSRVTQAETDIATQTARIDNIASLPSGSTSGDAELMDIRIKADGTTANNAGTAVRSQISDITTDIGERFVTFTGTSGYIGVNADGTPKTVSSEQFEISEVIQVSKGEIIRFKAAGYNTAVVMIAECTQGGSLTRVLEKSTGSTVTTYEHTAEWDMYIKVSYDKRRDHVLSVFDSSSNKYLDNFVNTLDFASSGENITSTSYNLNDCSPNKIYLVSAKCVNVPSTANGGICYINARRNNSVDTYSQTFIDLGGNIYTRFKAYGGTWGDWKSSYHAVMGSGTNILDSSFDLDNCLPNQIYVISVKCVNAPSTGVCYTLSNKSNATDTYCQMFVSTSGICFTRFKNYGGTWTVWRRHSNDSLDTYAKLSLFDTVGVVGDSYASGEIYSSSGSLIGDRYKISWPQQLARRNGFTAYNFSTGGLSTRTWLTSARGLSMLNDTEALDLYILALGINDYYSLGINYLGTISDMDDAEADTFYGNYAKIIRAIQAKAPNAKIMIANIAIRVSADASNREVINAFNTAIANIADKFNIPVIDQCNYEYFQSTDYNDNMYHGHPTAVGYSAMATAMENCISKAMIDNKAYFEDADYS